MYLRIAAGIIVVVALSASHWKMYLLGQRDVKREVEVATYKAEQAQHEKQQRLLAEKQTLEEQYAKSKKTSDAVVRSTRNELDRLRNQLRSYSERQNSVTCPRIDADPRDTIIRECSEAAQSLARVADENGLKLKALQSYVTEVCLK
jgi:septal ring factor EnvC (AmiA/AmiB activator)